MIISVGARNSPLSKVQAEEVLKELQIFHPQIQFKMNWIETIGDNDLKTSLRYLDNTNFFTKEIDELQLQKAIRIAIHSAKDLPQPLPPGLKIVALTKGVDRRDALLLRPGDTIATLPLHAKIATSSLRREAVIKELRDDFVAVDIRGTIERRLKQLLDGNVDGLLIAKAALIRLQLEYHNHIVLEHETPKYQGRLAIVANSDDQEMEQLFACIDFRIKRALHLGLEVTNMPSDIEWVHHPIIETSPLPVAEYQQIASATHVIITSKMALYYLMQLLKDDIILNEVLQKPIISVGRATTCALQKHGFQKIYTAEEETSEGVIQLIDELKLMNAHLFWPHSAQSRPIIGDFLRASKISYTECILYETRGRRNFCAPDLNEVEAIFFSSPSTCDAYLALIGPIPHDKILLAKGATTLHHLQKISTNHKLTIF